MIVDLQFSFPVITVNLNPDSPECVVESVMNCTKKLFPDVVFSGFATQKPSQHTLSPRGVDELDVPKTFVKKLRDGLCSIHLHVEFNATITYFFFVCRCVF